MYYVRLKENHRLTEKMKEDVLKLELESPEKRFKEDNREAIEIYRKGNLIECEKFIEEIEDIDLKKQFEIVII